MLLNRWKQCNRETLRCQDKIENQTLGVHILSIIQEEVKQCEKKSFNVVESGHGRDAKGLRWSEF